MKKLLSLLMAVTLIASLAACGGGDDESAITYKDFDEEGKIVMGFVPSQDADKIADTVEPLKEKLEEILGIEVEAQVMTDYVGLVEGMRTGRIDIGFLPPFAYVQAEDRANVDVILKAVRFGSSSYRAQYNVPADSDIQSIEDLVSKTGLRWAFGDVSSTSGFLFPGSQLMDMGVADLNAHFNPFPVGAHDTALVALLNGDADFATTYEDARTRIEKDYPNALKDIRVIGYSAPIPNDGVSVSEQVSPEWKEKLTTAFLSFNDDEDMLQVLQDVYNWTGIAKASSEDYQVVRETYEKFKDQINE
jgi:phosphonate transport system substrate-binding protein